MSDHRPPPPMRQPWSSQPRSSELSSSAGPPRRCLSGSPRSTACWRTGSMSCWRCWSSTPHASGSRSSSDSLMAPSACTARSATPSVEFVPCEKICSVCPPKIRSVQRSSTCRTYQTFAMVLSGGLHVGMPAMISFLLPASSLQCFEKNENCLCELALNDKGRCLEAFGDAS